MFGPLLGFLGTKTHVITEGTKCGRVFISKDNYGGSTCHNSKRDYGVYEIVVLYSKLWRFLITAIL